MSKKNYPVHPDITNDMWEKIDHVIHRHRPNQGSVIAALRECQDIVGYLPIELIDYISQGLGLSKSEVFGVASFYTLFSLTPKGKHTIRVCLGTACYVKGIKEVMERIGYDFGIREGETSDDRRFSLEAVRCLGACGLAPVVVVDNDTYGAVKAEKITTVLNDYE
jgi:NADH-quinone oxidoreductase subunit E